MGVGLCLCWTTLPLWCRHCCYLQYMYYLGTCNGMITDPLLNSLIVNNPSPPLSIIVMMPIGVTTMAQSIVVNDRLVLNPSVSVLRQSLEHGRLHRSPDRLYHRLSWRLDGVFASCRETNFGWSSLSRSVRGPYLIYDAELSHEETDNADDSEDTEDDT